MGAARRHLARHVHQHQRRNSQLVERVAAEIDQAVNAARTVYITPSVTGKIIGYSTLEPTKASTKAVEATTTSRPQRTTTTSEEEAESTESKRRVKIRRGWNVC